MKKSIYLLSFLLYAFMVQAQDVPPLERTVTITFSGERLDAALSRLSQAGQFTFSYNPSVIVGAQVVNKEYTNLSVREVLNDLTGASLTTKEKGNYIILNKAPVPPKSQSGQLSPMTLSGYVFNGHTGEKLAEVSVYDKETLAATITNPYGFFKLTIDKPVGDISLSFNKSRFVDTVVVWQRGSSAFLNIGLITEAPQVIVQRVTDTIRMASAPVYEKEMEPASEPIVAPKPTSESEINMLNIKDTLYRDVQVSAVPFVGTNHKLSGNVINRYSFNVFGGYSMGTQELEIGGLFNVNRSDVQGLQLAGMFNVVGGDVVGVQMAGLANTVKGEVHAGQFAGLFNVAGDTVRGPQFAGLFNMNLKESQGAQFAGLFNVAIDDYTGSQFAGLLNIGVAELSGSQVAGLINYGTAVKGAQIGFLNISDSIQGVPFGFMSLSRKGYHKLELSANETIYANVAFRTGVHQFYNIFTAGIRPENNVTINPSIPLSQNGVLWSFGYGVGTAPRLTKWLDINIDITSSHISKGKFTESLSMLNKVYLGLDWHIAKKFSFTLGGTVNAYLSDSEFEETPQLHSDFAPGLLTNKTYRGGTNLKMWFGVSAGLRFF